VYDEGRWNECQGEEEVIVVWENKSWEGTHVYEQDEGKEQLVSHFIDFAVFTHPHSAPNPVQEHLA